MEEGRVCEEGKQERRAGRGFEAISAREARGGKRAVGRGGVSMWGMGGVGA